MDRRTAIKVLAGGMIGGGAASVGILTTAFKSDIPPMDKPKKLDFNAADPNWKYHKLDPVVTANLAYHAYLEGSCMYAIVHSFISQMAEKHGEPYASFPTHMMKYGHSGAGGYGTLCGALNGAAAMIGLFVANKDVQNALIKDLFQWYEKTSLPVFEPRKIILDYLPPRNISHSTLCHASTTTWSHISGKRVQSEERSERCRRLTGDVATQLVTMMNQMSDHNYITAGLDNKETHACISCHGKEGKLGNSRTEMNCASCHSDSIGHKLFGDIHYKHMDKIE